MNSSAPHSLSPARVTRLVLVVVALVLASFTVGSMPAAAHDELAGSDPEAGSTLDSVPAEIVLTYSGDLIAEESATDVIVRDSDGRELQSGSPVIDGRLVTQALDASDVRGTVVVQWRVVSSDGHPIAGDFVFGVGEAPVEPTTAPSGTPAEPGSPDLAHFLWIVGALVFAAVGGAVVYLLVRRARGGGDGAAGGAEGDSGRSSER